MLTAIVLGAAQGARHAFEPDHLAAVSVLAGTSRRARETAALGAIWGLGHTISILAVSVALAAFGAALPDVADRVFTLLVAALLVALGARALRPAPPHEPRPRIRTPLQALIVGAIHGLAGTSALTAMVFAALPDTGARLAYIAMFGLGSIAGMAAVSGLAGAWLPRVIRPSILTALRLAIGASSIAIGVSTAAGALQ